MLTENDIDHLDSLLSGERRYHSFFSQILTFCRTPRTYLQVQEYALDLLKDSVSIHTPQVLIQWLDEFGGIQRLEVEGDGCWQTTDAGIHILDREEPQAKLSSLLISKPALASVFQDILQFCTMPRRRIEIEEFLGGNPILQKARLGPAYFIQELENIGSLEWVDRRWRTNKPARGENVCTEHT